MKKDITNRVDIEKLVVDFYEKVRNDEILGEHFKVVTSDNWEAHLKIMADFWENVIFYTGIYEGNPMEKHYALHFKKQFKESDFAHWTRLFDYTVDHCFQGENATLIKQKALSIGSIMQSKLFK